MRMLRGLYACWNAVRPAWPSAVLAAVVIGLYAFTPQMIEVFRLEALRLRSGDPVQIASLIPSWFGLVLLGSVLYACSVYALFETYPFTERASQSTVLRLWTARLIGGATSFGLLATFLVQTPEFGAPAWAGAAALSTVCLLYTLTARPIELWMLQRVPETPKRCSLAPGAGHVLLLLFVILLACTAVIVAAPMQSASLLGPIGTASVGFAVWGFIAALFVVGVNKTGMPPALIYVVAAIGLFGLFNDNHELRPVTDAPKPQPVSIDEHAARWVADRLQARPEVDELHPMVVLAEGGGVRAAYFTGAVLGQLHERTQGRSTADLYAVSGVSGGGVGLVSFMAAVADEREGRTCDGLGVLGRVRRHLSRDLLSPGIVGLLFFDTPQKFLPVALLPDRAALFEDSLIDKQACAGEDARLLARPLDELLDRAAAEGAAPPALLISATRTDTGALEVVSNVSPGWPLNGLGRAEAAPSAAAVAYLGARFPLIAPSGWLSPKPGGERIRYVDGGYNDMSGAVAAREPVEAVRRLQAALNSVVANRCTPTPAFDALQATALTKARLSAALFRKDGSCREIILQPAILNLMAREVDPADVPSPISARAVAAGASLAGEVAPLDAVPAIRTGRPFEEFLAPIETLFAARHQRRWDVAELLCRYNAPEPDACRELRRERFRNSEAGTPQDIARRTELFGRTRWLDVYLDYGAARPRYTAVSYSGAVEHVPLGWYLGTLDEYVDARAEAESKIAVQVLAAPPPPAPETPAGAPAAP